LKIKTFGGFEDSCPVGPAPINQWQIRYYF
jgi:hypothetical protein